MRKEGDRLIIEPMWSHRGRATQSFHSPGLTDQRSRCRPTARS
jgi:hypothetical protein